MPLFVNDSGASTTVEIQVQTGCGRLSNEAGASQLAVAVMLKGLPSVNDSGASSTVHQCMTTSVVRWRVNSSASSSYCRHVFDYKCRQVESEQFSFCTTVDMCMTASVDRWRVTEECLLLATVG